MHSFIKVKLHFMYNSRQSIWGRFLKAKIIPIYQISWLFSALSSIYGNTMPIRLKEWTRTKLNLIIKSEISKYHLSLFSFLSAINLWPIASSVLPYIFRSFHVFDNLFLINSLFNYSVVFLWLSFTLMKCKFN